ncbi:MAG: hypothetical protein HY937_02040 [Nitrosomonadales bacterium]|nr:hypothetical protein [Nitrosomonadales bacterium]
MSRYLLAWFVMLLVSVANGTLRDFTYGKHLSELLAHQLSTLSGMALLGLVIFAFVRRWPPVSARQALSIGLFWMALTVAFEFLFFHFVSVHPWSVLLANYDLLHGRVWVLLLAWVAFAPYLFYRLR